MSVPSSSTDERVEGKVQYNWVEEEFLVFSSGFVHRTLIQLRMTVIEFLTLDIHLLRQSLNDIVKVDVSGIP